MAIGKHKHSVEKCRAMVTKHIKLHITEDKMPRLRAIAAAYSEARKAGCIIPSRKLKS